MSQFTSGFGEGSATCAPLNNLNSTSARAKSPKAPRQEIEQWSRAAAAALAGDAVATPNTLEHVARRQRVQAIKVAQIDRAGMLIPIEGGFVMKIRGVTASSSERRRRRWTIAHEIAHTLFYSIDSSVPEHRHPESLPADVDEERVCDLVAEYLLLPESRFGVRARETDPGIEALRLLSEEFDVSLHAVARALIDRNLWDFVAMSVRADWTDKRPFRVDWAVSPSSHWIPRDGHVDEIGSKRLQRCISGRSVFERGPDEVKVGRYRFQADNMEFAAVSLNRRALLFLNLTQHRNV